MAQNGGVSEALPAICWSGTQWMAAGAYGTLIASSDGISWTPQPTPTGHWFSGLACRRDTAVAVGSIGMVLVKRSDRLFDAGFD